MTHKPHDLWCFLFWKWRLPEPPLDLLHCSPVVPRRYVLLQQPRLPCVRLPVGVAAALRCVVRLGARWTRRRLLRGIRPLASVGLLVHAGRSVAAAVDGGSPPAAGRPSDLGFVAHVCSSPHAKIMNFFFFNKRAGDSNQFFYLSHIVGGMVLTPGALQTERRWTAALEPNRVSVCSDKAFHHHDWRCKWQEGVATSVFHLHIPQSGPQVIFRMNRLPSFDSFWGSLGGNSCRFQIGMTTLKKIWNN